MQRMNGNNKTFAQLAESVLAMVLYMGGQSGKVDVVFDVYRQPSIKYYERLNRCASTTVQYSRLARVHNIQQWRKFLSCSFNKTSLIKFLVGEWKGQRYRENAARQGIVCNLRRNLHQDLLLLSCPSHNVLPLAGACLCPLCHCGHIVSRTGLV